MDENDNVKRFRVTKSYRELLTNLHGHRQEYLLPTDHHLSQSLDSCNQIFVNVKTPREAVLDAVTLKTISNFVYHQTCAINRISTRDDAFRFARKCANVLKSMSSNSICEESYVKFYQMFSCYHQIAPTTNFMFGRIPTGLFEKKQIEKAKLHVPREKREDFESQRTKIDEVSSKLIRAGKVSTLSSHGEQTSKEVVKINKYLLQAFKRNHNEPVEFFPFVLHPTNFARTVENMFHITFLIKEGLAQLFHDNNDLPLICKSGRNDFFYNLPVDRRKKKADETINIEHNETTTTTSLSKKCQQLVISIDMEEWEALVEAFGIETPVMPDK
ncbi:unnamed protein product [Didymodactylos carnosus]|uniref:Non-structural maintenance of chromosomes element 4 n=1 Tax=Didymodactylos carnosus TaxID=1234261 RepID=A0A813XHY6_9BILA|nr:unnamed protein product [Didymodactylos carnosus]CAF3655925.1 unnamed protein product [Didymodactylos carnosus]